MTYTEKLVKGQIVKLRSGWFAVAYETMRSPRTETLGLAVAGFQNEMGSCYTRDIEKSAEGFKVYSEAQIENFALMSGQIDETQAAYLISMSRRHTKNKK